MNESAVVTNAPSAPAQVSRPAPAPDGKSSVASRASALKARLETEGGPPEAPVEAPATETAADAPAATPDAMASPALSPTAEARRQRLAEVAERERARRTEAEAKKASKARDEELQALQKRLAESESKAKESDEVFASEDAFFAAAERRGLKADKLIERIRLALTDPAAIAKTQAEAGDKVVLSELQKLQKELNDLRAERAREQEESKSRSASERKTNEFRQKASDPAQYPLVSSLVKNRGEQAVIALANEVIIPHLSEDYEVGNLLDHLETHLEYFQVSPGQSPPPTKKIAGGDAPVPTLSNSVTAGRESMAEEIPLHKLSRAERIRLAKERLGK